MRFIGKWRDGDLADTGDEILQLVKICRSEVVFFCLNVSFHFIYSCQVNLDRFRQPRRRGDEETAGITHL